MNRLQAGTGFRITHNRGDYRDEFVSFDPQLGRFVDGSNVARFMEPQSAVSFTNFLQADGAFGDEISLAFGGPSLFEHGKKRGAAIEKLRSHELGDSADLIEAFAKLDDATRESKRAISDILSRLERII